MFNMMFKDMGMLVAFSLMAGIVYRVVCGIVAKFIAFKRGMKGQGFCWGFFMGMVGIIVMRCCPKY